MTVDADPNTDADFIVDIGDPAACQEILRAPEGCVVESIHGAPPCEAGAPRCAQQQVSKKHPDGKEGFQDQDVDEHLVRRRFNQRRALLMFRFLVDRLKLRNPDLVVSLESPANNGLFGNPDWIDMRYLYKILVLPYSHCSGPLGGLGYCKPGEFACDGLVPELGRDFKDYGCQCKKKQPGLVGQALRNAACYPESVAARFAAIIAGSVRVRRLAPTNPERLTAEARRAAAYESAHGAEDRKRLAAVAAPGARAGKKRRRGG